ncbi:MAG: diguanylate cyclase [Pyrinomonadaceae bacterium]
MLERLALAPIRNISAAKAIFMRQTKVKQEIPEKQVLDRLADESGLAIAIVDENTREILVSNNNSICRNLNPDGKFNEKCAAFCGTALVETFEIGASASFTCHAGLECRAVPLGQSAKRFVAIVGRAFVKAENYRRATERAISGDWSKFAPSEFFENILLTSSTTIIDKVAGQVEALVPELPNIPRVIDLPIEPDKGPPPHTELQPQKKSPDEITNLVERFNREIRSKTPAEETGPDITKPQPIAEPKPEPIDKRTAELQAWRGFFGSLLKADYSKAADSILEFIAHNYGLMSLVWLEKVSDGFENTAAFGEMKNRKVRLGIAPDDRRLIEALQNEMPLELGEKERDESGTVRTMHLFPVGVGGEVSAAIAVLDPLEPVSLKKQVAKICSSIAPQLEILRLRRDAASRELLAAAVRRFSESIKTIDADDFWLNLTQNAAEMLQAERASLLVLDERADLLEIKALIGSRGAIAETGEVGSRVAKIVFVKNEPVFVSDIGKTSLPPTPNGRNYKTPSFMSCPVTIGGRVIGVMNFADRANGKPFDKASLDLFEAIAPHLAVAIDRANLKEKAGEFEQLSVTDPLTGLLNRRYIEERLMEETKRSNRHGFPMSFMMLDVDQFKSYNDSFGHPAGDEALKIVGNVIRETLRGADVAARFGGEEFSILLPQTTGEEAVTIAERIRSNIEETDFPHRRVTLSIGVASCSAELCSSENIVSAADKALYEAKRNGRNRVKVFGEVNGVAHG